MPGRGWMKGKGWRKGRGRGRGWRWWTGNVAQRGICRRLPKVDEEKCVGCGKCAKECPAGAITIVDKKAHINPQLCRRCGHCAQVCPRKAIHY